MRSSIPRGACRERASCAGCISAPWGESVRTVIRNRKGRMRPGDAYVLNAPYDGGTHLPDVTVISPVFTTAPRSPFSLLPPGTPCGYRRAHAGLRAAGQPEHP